MPDTYNITATINQLHITTTAAANFLIYSTHNWPLACVPLMPNLSKTPIYQPHLTVSSKRPVPLAAGAGCGRRHCWRPTCALSLPAPSQSRCPASVVTARAASGGSTAGNGNTNGSSLEVPPPAGPSDNGGNGSAGGGGGRGQLSGDDSGSNGNGRQPGFSLPLSSETLSYAVLALTGLSALLLFAALRQSVLLRALDSGLQTVYDSLVSRAALTSV